jgi:hypothetical protein
MSTTDDLAVATEIAQLLRLDGASRLYMLLDLRCLLQNGQVITPDDWRAAYGKAADFQTVKNAREVLEPEEVAS